MWFYGFFHARLSHGASIINELLWHSPVSINYGIHLQVEVKEKVSQNKNNFTFSEVLSACERLAEHTKTQIDDLQEHLAKYGYKPSKYWHFIGTSAHSKLISLV